MNQREYRLQRRLWLLFLCVIAISLFATGIGVAFGKQSERLQPRAAPPALRPVAVSSQVCTRHGDL